METKFKVGDEVYCPLFGDGKVVDVEINDAYPIIVVFKNSPTNRFYTEDGRYFTRSLPTLRLKSELAKEAFPRLAKHGDEEVTLLCSFEEKYYMGTVGSILTGRTTCKFKKDKITELPTEPNPESLPEYTMEELNKIGEALETLNGLIGNLRGKK